MRCTDYSFKHSSQRLPPDARLMLLRDAQGVASFPQMSAARARSILSGGRQRELCVLVEDDFAKLLLTEMIRRIDRELLRCVEIHDVGDKKAVRTGALFMKRIGRAYVAVRDPDVGADPVNGLLSFPGLHAPEREVYMNIDVQIHINAEFGIDVVHVFAQQAVTNHHEFTRTLAEEASALPDYLRTLAIKRYLDSVGKTVFQPLVATIQGRLP